MSAQPARSLLEAAALTLPRMPYVPWNFGDSVAFEAMIDASSTLEDRRWSGFALGFARAWASEDRPFRQLDCTAPGSAFVRLGTEFDDAALLGAALRLAEFLADSPVLAGVYRTWDHSPLLSPYGNGHLPAAEVELLQRKPAGVFLDCLHFTPPFFAVLGRALGDDRWTERAVRQALGYIELLQQPDGLFDHFVLDGVPGSFGPGWGRGQGWALLGLLDVIAALPAYSDARDKLAVSACKLISRMLELQRGDGHWNAVVDQPDCEPESSTAAFMVAGFLRAVRLNVTPAAEVEGAARRALAATRSCVDGAGRLRGVSAAVYASTSSDHYRFVPRGFTVPWGQGPLVLALVEAIRTGLDED